MRMIHGTDAKHLFTIGRRGIRADLAKGPHKTVWLCGPSMVGAAIGHAMKRHGIPIDRVVVIAVDVPRSWLRKVARRGLRHTGGRDIPPEWIEDVYELREARVLMLGVGDTAAGSACHPSGEQAATDVVAIRPAQRPLGRHSLRGRSGQ